ncbi:hypothetical protein AL755_09405 [Arthrobacter sp. ERGS1:01]|uniref:hypothetical protein n=1 Tax=Arthrobacter sp. ERGS1:01 TaxID=1704044 RepID=UPI0006B4E69D|nr:hypothetical protein [Arthrobacter sp. ERGS1:01]ALE05648.1 hypothetical protein AL755_09405 [Arthrobacter sp. ERGS1:01]
MNLEHYFDAIYYSMNAAVFLLLAAAVGRGIVLTRRPGIASDIEHGRGTVFAGAGTMVALAGGLMADALLKTSVWFQQVRFGLYFLGFALIMVGTCTILRGSEREGIGFLSHIRRILLPLFALTVIISGFFLSAPETFIHNSNNQQIQLAVYWLPLLLPTAVGSIALFSAAALSRSEGRRRTILVGAFESLLFLGLLRESGILQDLGDPLINLLVSFVPFMLAALFLFAGTFPRRQRQRQEHNTGL